MKFISTFHVKYSIPNLNVLIEEVDVTPKAKRKNELCGFFSLGFAPL